MLIFECVNISFGPSVYVFCSLNTHLTNWQMAITLSLYSAVPRKVYNFLTKSHQVTHCGKKMGKTNSNGIWEKELQLFHI